MFIYKSNLRVFYYTLIAFIIIALSSATFFQNMLTLNLTEDRRYVIQASKNTVMGKIYDSERQVLGKGTALGMETWNSDYSISMGNVLGPSLTLSKINAYYSRSYFADILYGQKQEHLSFSDLISTSSTRIGGNVQLTINADFQNYIYYTLSARFPESAAVVLNYKTGELLAAVSVPSFDLNEESTLNISKEENTDSNGKTTTYSYLDDERAVSNALHELYMPGSVIKGLLYTAALQYDPSLFDTDYTCDGVHKNKYGIEIKCAGGTAHGLLKDMESALSVSCNGYAETIFESLTATEEGRRVLSETMHAFGFDTSISYPGMVYSDGIFLGRDPEHSEYTSSEESYEEALEKKRSLESYSAIGGGPCRTTVFGVAAAYAALANRGTLIEPHMIKGFSLTPNSPLSPFASESSREVCSPDVAEKILDMMEKVTDYGTGKKMAVDGLRVCSKTGTAGHNDPSLETLWAVAVIDSEDYPYVVVVMLNNTDASTQNSSTDAGGMVHEILKYLI